MKALFLGIIAAIVIAVIAGVALEIVQQPVSDRYAVPTSVRLGNS